MLTKLRTTKSKVIRLLLILPIIGVTLIGCVEDLDHVCRMENAQPIETFFEDEFRALNCSPEDLQGDSLSEIYVIKNQSDYIKHILCSADLPEVNFDDYFILAGIYSHHQCAIFKSQSVVICGDQLIHTVFLLEQDCLAVTPVSYMTAVSRKFENKAIRFEVEFVN